MSLINNILTWLKKGEDVEGTDISTPTVPDGVLNRPLKELLDNDTDLDSRLTSIENSSGGGTITSVNGDVGPAVVLDVSPSIHTHSHASLTGIVGVDGVHLTNAEKTTFDGLDGRISTNESNITSLQSSPSGSIPNKQVHYTSGSFSVPVGVSRMRVTAIGEGGWGGSSTVIGGGGGGSSSTHVTQNISVSAGDTIEFVLNPTTFPVAAGDGPSGSDTIIKKFNLSTLTYTQIISKGGEGGKGASGVGSSNGFGGILIVGGSSAIDDDYSVIIDFGTDNGSFGNVGNTIQSSGGKGGYSSLGYGSGGRGANGGTAFDGLGSQINGGQGVAILEW